MVLWVDVVDAAPSGVSTVTAKGPGRWFSARRRVLDDAGSPNSRPNQSLALLCGRYEGFRPPVHEHLADDEISIGHTAYWLVASCRPWCFADTTRCQPGAPATRNRRSRESRPRPRRAARIPALHPSTRVLPVSPT